MSQAQPIPKKPVETAATTPNRTTSQSAIASATFEDSTVGDQVQVRNQARGEAQASIRQLTAGDRSVIENHADAKIARTSHPAFETGFVKTPVPQASFSSLSFLSALPTPSAVVGSMPAAEDCPVSSERPMLASSHISGTVVNSGASVSSMAVGQMTVYAPHATFFPAVSEALEAKRLEAAVSSDSTGIATAEILPDPVETFVGREDLLETLEKYFHAPDQKASASPSPLGTSATASTVVLNTGLGGMGKTQLALYYAKHAKKTYPRRFCFQAETPEGLATSYRQLAKKYRLIEAQADDASVREAVKRWLSTQPSWLAIYDNVEKYADVAPYLPLHSSGDILLTSRLAPSQWPKKTLVVELTVLTLPDACQLLRTLMEREAEISDIETLAKTLGCLPLALAQAGAYLCQNSTLSVAEYLAFYQKRAAYLLRQKLLPTASVSHEPVGITWDISLQAIEAEEKSERKEVKAMQLLQFCAYLNPDGIPLTLLKKWHETTFPRTEEPLAEVMGRLQKYSFLSIDSTTQTSVIRIHRLVQQVVREQGAQEIQTQQLNQALQIVNAAYPQDDQGVGLTLDAIRAGFMPHLEAVIGHHSPHPHEKNTDLATALLLLADAYHDLGNPQEERCLLERALKIFEIQYGPKHWKTAITLHNLASAYRGLGNLQHELRLLKRALKIKETHYGAEHWQTATTLHCLANAYGDLGNPQEKCRLLEQVLKINEAHYGAEHWRIANTLCDLAGAHLDLGNPQEAHRLLERALKMHEVQYGSEDWRTAITLDNLASAYRKLGNPQEARRLVERALKIDEAHYGHEHWQTAFTLQNLAKVHQALGNSQETRRLLERVLKIKEAHYGSEHWRTALTYYNLARAYTGLKDFSKARILAEKVIPIWTQHYGSTHPHTKRALRLLAEIPTAPIDSATDAAPALGRGFALLGRDVALLSPLTSSVSDTGLVTAPKDQKEQDASTSIHGSFHPAKSVRSFGVSAQPFTPHATPSPVLGDGTELLEATLPIQAMDFSTQASSVRAEPSLSRKRRRTDSGEGSGYPLSAGFFVNGASATAGVLDALSGSTQSSTQETQTTELTQSILLEK